MKNELFLALTQLAAERNLPQSIVVSAVKEALASAYRKDPAAKGQDILVEVDSETGDVIVKTILNVKEEEEIEDPLSEISEEEAQKINKDLRVGDFIETGFEIPDELDFGYGNLNTCIAAIKFEKVSDGD